MANRMLSSGLKGRGAGEWAGRISRKSAVVAGKFDEGAGEWGWSGISRQGSSGARVEGDAAGEWGAGEWGAGEWARGWWADGQ